MKLSMLLSVAALSFLSATAGCAADSSGDTPGSDEGVGEEELKASECPTKVEVLLQKPSILSDTVMKSAWQRDMSKSEADEQYTALKSHVAKARSQTAVKLVGTRNRGCFYATVDAQTGQKNGYSFWFAKSGGRNGELQIRIERDLGTPDDVLFFKSKLSSLSPTSVEVDTTKKGTVYAQHHEEGYHGEPDGPNAWIGSAVVSAVLAP